GWAIFADVLLLGGVLFGLSLLVRASPWPMLHRVFNHLFLLALISGALTLIPMKILRPYPECGRYYMLWLGIFGVLGFSCGSPRTWLVRWGANLCLIFSPLVAILLIQTALMTRWAELPQPRRPLVARGPVSGSEAKPPVFIFVFDEWSYDLTTRDGAFLGDFPNLQRVSSQSLNFRQAWSFSSRSMHSM